MAILFAMTMPEGVPVAMLDAVRDEMNARSDAPAGMIVHTVNDEGGRVRVVDVWDSVEDHQKFEADRLRPAMAKVTERLGIDISTGPQPETTTTELHDVVNRPGVSGDFGVSRLWRSRIIGF